MTTGDVIGSAPRLGAGEPRAWARIDGWEHVRTFILLSLEFIVDDVRPY